MITLLDEALSNVKLKTFSFMLYKSKTFIIVLYLLAHDVDKKFYKIQLIYLFFKSANPIDIMGSDTNITFRATSPSGQ